MKIKKFLRSLITVVFTVLLLFVFVVPIFAAGPGGQPIPDYPLGGGGGVGAGYRGISAPVPLTFSFYYDLGSTPVPIDTDGSLYSRSCYVSHVVYPSFNYSWFGDSTSGSYTLQSFSDIAISSTSVKTFTIRSDYSNFSSVDIADEASSGLLTCDVGFHTSLNSYERYFRISLSATDFFAFTSDRFDQNSEFCLKIPYDYHVLFVEDNPNATVRMKYRRLNVSGTSNDDQDYQEVTFPLSFFLDGDYLVIDPGSYLAATDHFGFYHIQDFYIDLPCSLTGGSYLLCSLSYVYDQMFLDPYRYVVPHNPRLELSDYTAWISNAVSGFLQIEIFPGFYISGLLMVIIAFCVVMWFLKIFAGG